MASKVKTINLQGKEYVQYPELLDLAHAAGLCRITTKIVQVPTEANKNTAIVEAEVVIRDRETGIENSFTGIGDACPTNVNRNIANHLLRMAETRSKARAMRDAINVGYIDDELLEASESAVEAPAQPAQGTSAGTPPASRAQAPQQGASGAAKAQPATAPAQATATASQAAPAGTGGVPADGGVTQKDINLIGYHMERAGWSDEQGRSYLFNSFGKQARKQLTPAEAAQMIGHLKALPACDAWLESQGAGAGAGA